MATVTVELPDPLRSWVEDRAQSDGFESVGDYVRDLVRRDREKAGAELSIDELRARIAEAKASGISNRDVDAIFEEAKRLARPAQDR